jgi:hypothetical protein
MRRMASKSSQNEIWLGETISVGEKDVTLNGLVTRVSIILRVTFEVV